MQKIEIEGISFSLIDPQNGFEFTLERIDSVVLTILSDADTFVLDFHLHNRLGININALKQSFNSLIAIQTFLQKISKPFEEFQYLVFLKDSKETRLSINLNFSEFLFTAQIEDQKLALRLNHPNYNFNIEYPKLFKSTYVTFFSLELKWNDRNLFSIYNLRQIESPAQAEFQMMHISPKIDTNFLLNLTEESSELNRTSLYTKNCCINSVEFLVELNELLASLSGIYEFTGSISEILENMNKGMEVHSPQSLKAPQAIRSSSNPPAIKKYSTIWNIEFLQNSFKFNLKKPARSSTFLHYFHPS